MRNFMLCLLTVFVMLAGKNISYAQDQDTVWQNLQSYFSPPQEYANSFGNYRSPLKFYDGKMVKSKKDWSKRRKEILHRWQDLLGHWPPLIENPVVEILDSIHIENFTRYKIRFNWRTDEKTTGYVLVPDGEGKKPAVITVFYEPETGAGIGRPYADWALQLVRRGFITLSVGTDGFFRAKPYSQYYPNPDSAILQPLSMLGYLAANCWNMLSHWKNVDSKKIGIVGHSYGSKWAMFASCLYEKFACAAWSDGGIVFDDARPNVNYWDPWYLGYYQPPWDDKLNESRTKGVYPKLRAEGYDLHELHALMAPRPFLVSGGSEDKPERWVPLNHAIAVNHLLGYQNRVGMTNRKEHTPDKEANDAICRFFEHFLR